MLKQNELRYGNLFMDRTGLNKIVMGIESAGIVTGEHFEAKERGHVHSGAIEAVTVKAYVAYDQSAGIKLTPDILKKCGFEMMAIGKYDNWGNWHLTLQDNHLLSFDDRDNNFSYNGCTLWHSPKHVHELQNLYFALTGLELEVKL